MTFGSDICKVRWALMRKKLTNGQRAYWAKELRRLINDPATNIAVEVPWDPRQCEPLPVPYEVEFGLPNAGDCIAWFEFFKRQHLTPLAA